jgi:hypothetical protein
VDYSPPRWRPCVASRSDITLNLHPQTPILFIDRRAYSSLPLLDHPLHTLQPPQQAEMLITAAYVLRFLVRLNSCNHSSAFALTRALPPADYSAQCSPLPPPPNLFSSLQPPPPLPPPDAFTGVTGAMMTGDSIGVASAMDPLSL